MGFSGGIVAGRRTGSLRHEQPVKRQTDNQMGGGPGETSGPPADLGFHEGGDRPADGAGEPGHKGDAGDGAPGIAAVEAGQGRKGGIIKTHGHADTDDEPGGEQAEGILGQAEHPQAGGEHKVRRP